MKKIVFATNNQHKKEEVANILAVKYEVLNLKDINCLTDIPETGNTFAENATLKSTFVYKKFGLDCFADDSGLEVEVLNNAPGIFSARYSGERDDLKNLQRLLENLEGKINRRARFRTVISLIQEGKNHLFEGSIEGTIRLEPSGSKGFGYDPVFQPDGYDITFAEMDMKEKNRISHRALAMQKLIAFLEK